MILVLDPKVAGVLSNVSFILEQLLCQLSSYCRDNSNCETIQKNPKISRLERISVRKILSKYRDWTVSFPLNLFRDRKLCLDPKLLDERKIIDTHDILESAALSFCTFILLEPLW